MVDSVSNDVRCTESKVPKSVFVVEDEASSVGVVTVDGSRSRSVEGALMGNRSG